MNRENIARAVLIGTLLAFLTPSILQALDAVELQLDVRLTWTATRQDPGPRCFKVRLAVPGILGIELTAEAPSTSPEVFILPVNSDGASPATVERTETTLLRVLRAGEHLVCLTSEVRLGRFELLATFAAAEWPDKERDEEETELEPDPQPEP